MKKRKLILPANGDLVLPVSASTHREPAKVFLGMPTRSGFVSCGAAQSAMVQVTRSRTVLFRSSTHTNLELNYNMLLCDALNLRKQEGVTWFAMLHDDVQPEPFWVDTLIDEAEAYDADFMSAHVPLKDPRGYTSTALSDPADKWFPFTRLTLKQIHHPDFPETVDTKLAVDALRNLPSNMFIDCPCDSQLLINTGCMVMRVNRPWIDQIRFHKKDAIIQDGDAQVPVTWTEDWVLAQDLARLGAKAMATRKVRLTHFDGKQFWPSEPSAHGQDVDESTIQVRTYRQGVRA